MQLGPGLRAAVVRDLARSNLQRGGVRSYLSRGNVVPLNQIHPTGFEFDVEDIDSLLEHLAGDFSRFALSALESFYRSREGGTGLNYYAWRLLESYYASFFAAHALMRALGGGISQFGDAEVDRLRDLAQLYGVPNFTLPTGSVLFDIYQSGDDWRISFKSASRGKGVHDGFWRDFCSFLQRKAQEAVAIGLPDATDFLAGAIQLSSSISTGPAGSASWLAEVRNAINYRHEYDVWFPPHKSVNVDFRNRRKGDDAEISFRLDLSKKKESLYLFENVNSKIVHILWDVSELFSSISKRPGHFGGKYARLIAAKA